MGMARSARSSPARATRASSRTSAASSRPSGTFDPGVARGRGRLRHRRLGRARSEWCDGRVGLWGESYYGFTSLAAAISGHPAVRVHRARRHRAPTGGASGTGGGALQLNTAGYWAIAMDDAEYADLIAVDPWHLPLVGNGGGGRAGAARTSGTSSTASRTTTGGAARAAPSAARGARARCSPGAAGTTTSSARSCTTTRDPGDAHRARDRAPAGRAVGPRGQRRAHRPRRLRPAAAAPGSTAGTPTRRSSTATCCDDRQRLRPRGRRSRCSRWAQRAGSASAAWPPPACDADADTTCAAGGVLSPSPPDGGRGAGHLSLRPRRPGRGDGRRQLLGALRRARRPPAARAAAGRRHATRRRRWTDDLELTRAGDGGAVRVDQRARTPTSRSRCVDVFADGTVNPIQDGIVRARYRDGMAAPAPVDPGAHRPRTSSTCSRPATSSRRGTGCRWTCRRAASTATTATRTTAGRTAREPADGRGTRRSTTRPRIRRTSCCPSCPPLLTAAGGHRPDPPCSPERLFCRTLQPFRRPAPCARMAGSRTFSMHRARSSLQPPSRVQQPVPSGAGSGTRGASRRRPPARCLVKREFAPAAPSERATGATCCGASVARGRVVAGRRLQQPTAEDPDQLCRAHVGTDPQDPSHECTLRSRLIDDPRLPPHRHRAHVPQVPAESCR